MPRTATVLAAQDEETTTHVDELIQRGRGQGYLSLPELRDAFDQARVSPSEARSIIRELTEAGVELGNEPSDGVEAGTVRSAAAPPAVADDGQAEVELAGQLSGQLQRLALWADHDRKRRHENKN